MSTDVRTPVEEMRAAARKLRNSDLMRPALAVPCADWLDREARRIERIGDLNGWDTHPHMYEAESPEALTLAREVNRAGVPS